ISSTMGTASRRMARFRLPVVKSWCDPRSASRIDAHRLCSVVSPTAVFIAIPGRLSLRMQEKACTAAKNQCTGNVKQRKNCGAGLREDCREDGHAFNLPPVPNARERLEPIVGFYPNQAKQQRESEGQDSWTGVAAKYHSEPYGSVSRPCSNRSRHGSHF